MKSLLVLAISTVAGFWASASAAEVGDVPDRRPNIVLILADDVGQEVLGCYGGSSYETPHIDRLAREGLRFRHGYAMPVCHPTRVCLLSGKYPSRFGGVRWGSYPESAAGATLASLLRASGYATAIAGKWQLALLENDPDHPHRLGFDEYSVFAWHEGPRYHEPMIWQNGKIREGLEGRYGPDVYVDFLTDFMSRNRDRPFFAFYSMALCHAVTNDLEVPVPRAPNGLYQSYAELVDYMDLMVGRIVGAIEWLSLREKTLILFVTDNGTPAKFIRGVRDGKLFSEAVSSIRDGERIAGGKGSLDDRGTRVPWIANWKGKIAPRRTTDALVDMTDLLPTLIEVAGVHLPQKTQLDGRSFAAVLRGDTSEGRRWVYAETKKSGWARTRRYKLYSDGRFFDVGVDRRETSPLPSTALSGRGNEAHVELRRALDSVRVAAKPE